MSMRSWGFLVSLVVIVAAGSCASVQAPQPVQAPATVTAPAPGSVESGAPVPSASSSAAPLLFLGNANIAPVVYLDGTTPSGLGVDLVRALAAHMSRPVEIRAMDWTQAQGLVDNGQADALIQINSTEARRKIYDFSEPFLESHFSIFVREERTGIAGISSLDGLRVGVEAGGLPQQLLGQDPRIALSVIPNFPDGFRALRDGTIDAVVVDYRVGSYVLATQGIRGVKAAGDPISSSNSAIAVRKGNAALLGQINSALQAIKADGTYQRIVDTWAPTQGVFETQGQINERVYETAIGILAILLVMALVWVLTVNRQMRRRRIAVERQVEQHSTLRGIIDGAPTSIFSVDREYRYTSFNAGHARVMKTAYAADIEDGRCMLDYMTVPEDRAEAKHNLDRALAGEHLIEESYSGEDVQSRHYFRVSHSPVKTGDDVIGVAVLAQDLTEHKEAEDTLRRLNRELQAIRSCDQVMVRAEDESTLLNEVCRIICDEAGYRMAWVGFAENDEAKTIRPAAWAGFEDGYLGQAGITWADTERGRGPGGRAIRSGESTSQDFLVDPEAAPWREAALRRGYRTGIALPLKDQNAKVFGALNFYSTEANAFTSDERRLLGELADDLAFGIMVLRTRAERDRSDEALRASEEQYRRFVEDDVAGVFVTTPDGRVLTCNPAFAQMLGFASVNDVLTTNVVTIYQDPAARAAVLAELRAQRRIDHVEMAWQRRDGLPVAAIVTMIGEFDDKGELVRNRGYVIDNTERRRLEEQLQQSQKMEAIGRLAGGVAHDFNNLLTAINGYAELLAADMPPDDRRLPDVQEIRKAGTRAASLTRQLLAFSRRQVLQSVVLDLNEVVEGIVPMLRRLIGEQIDLVVLPGPDLGHVRADPSQLEQVLLNLVVNARDAMPAGGTLTIETADVEMDDEYVRAHPSVSAGSYVQLAVSDTGIGMSADTMEHLFEPFFTTKPVGEGTGLGLATVYGIVAQSGGHVAACSQPGCGAAFSVYLPRVPETLKLGGQIAAAPAGRGSETILLVEDEDAVRSFAERVLRDLGYIVHGVRSGAEALALAADGLEPIDLLITDVMLPGMDGREIAERLSADRAGMRTLFMSGYTKFSIVDRGELDPGVEFLPKPFTPSALGHAVRKALGAESAVLSDT